MKIAKKIGLSIFIVAAILTVIIASGFYIVSRNYLEKTVYTHLSAIARSKVHHIETFLNVGEESIKQLSKSIVIERFLLASEGDEDYNKRLNDIVRRLEDTNRTTKYAYEFFVLNEDGIIVASNIKGDIGKDKSSVPYFLGAGEGAFTKGALVSKDEKTNSITFSAQVFDEEDTAFLGIVAAKASMEEVNKITEDRAGLGRTGEICLVNKSGLMVTPSHFMKDAFLNLRVDTENTRKCFEDAQKSGSKPNSHELLVYTDYRGAKVWGVHEHIPQMACALWVKIDEKEALAPLATIELLAFIITGIVPIIAWLIGSLIAGAITSPIHKLHRGTEIIGEGNLDYKVGTDAKDEIGQLSRAFDEMTEDLRKTTTSIVNLNKEIADRKRVERELEKVNRQLEFSVEHANNLAQEATVAYLAKSQFLANMSHEIRTPMNAIIGFSQILEDENLTDEQRHYVDIVRESAEHLLQLINDILDFSKIEAGKFNIEIVDCSLEHLFAVVGSLMRPQAKEKGLAFEMLQCGSLPAQIHTDPVRLRQCLINLINNAVKFTEEGHVHVNVSLQEVDGEPFICFDIKDTGIGIPPDKQELVFDEFTQIDGSSTRRYSGTGLGLPITKKLAHHLGGELTVSSEIGKGSVFSLTIPANVDVKSLPRFDKCKRATELEQVRDTSEQDKFSGRVLVAEDSKSNQILTKLLLERFGVEVTIAEDGKEAVDKALSQQFDLIFMDMQMPNMDGYEATKLLRRKGLKTAIVALTAYAMKGDDEKCISAGCSDYIAKPIDREILLKLIRKYLPLETAVSGKRIDSIKSRGDEFGQLCSDETSQRQELAEPANEPDCEVPVDCTTLMRVCEDEDIVNK